MNERFWSRSTAELVAALGTTGAGLSSDEARRRLSEYGPNDAGAPPRSPAWRRLLARLRNPLIILLLLASGLRGITGDVTSFVIVVAIIALSVIIDFVQEERAQSAIDALRESVAVRARTLRDGVEVELPIAQLVPGDLVKLS